MIGGCCLHFVRESITFLLDRIICDIAIANTYLSCLKTNIISYKSIYVWVKYIESGSLLRDRIIRGRWLIITLTSNTFMRPNSTYSNFLEEMVVIHDNLCDFKIGRPPYLPDLKEGAYLFWGWWGFRGRQIHPRVNLLGGQWPNLVCLSCLTPRFCRLPLMPSNINTKHLNNRFLTAY